MRKYKGLLLLIGLFLLSIVIRLPNLNRPLSKHHEFNSAMVLINLESWRQTGQTLPFHLVPVMNYQGEANQLPLKDLYIDEKGNSVYLSYGPGWYVFSYLFYELFSVPSTPLPLQILNLFFNLAALLLLYRFLRFLSKEMGIQSVYPTLAGCFLFIFQPATLWFLGNGYVNIGIMLPLAILMVHISTKMLLHPATINIRNLVLLMISGVIAIYTDWFGVFLLFITGISALFLSFKNKKYLKVFLVCGFTALLGIALIFFQFASYVGWEQVQGYWLSRYANRGAGNSSNFTATAWINFISHFISGLMPAFLALFICGVYIFKKKIATNASAVGKNAFLLTLSSCMLYSLTLFNWSSDHNFSVLPYSIPLAILFFLFVARIQSNKFLLGTLITIFLSTILLYYYINRPGKISNNGMTYSEYQRIGETIPKIAEEDEKIFSNLSYPIYQYYAKRSFTTSESYEDALKFCKEYKISKGIWLKIEEMKDSIFITEIKPIRQLDNQKN